MSEDENTLDALTEAVVASSKYTRVSPELVRAIGAAELAKGLSLKSAVKATKSKLHQVGGAYQSSRINYDQALKELSNSGSDELSVRRKTMEQHASTKERLPILDSFFRVVLREIPPPRSILDIACGLNPLAIPWMPLTAGASYTAYDIYGDMTHFLGETMRMTDVNGRAEVRDVLQHPPVEEVDLALLLKALPCLEQLQKGASAALLDVLQARYLLISYPVYSLGGRRKGMVSTYEEQFGDLTAGRNWVIQRFLFSTELAFLVDTDAPQTDYDARI